MSNRLKFALLCLVLLLIANLLMVRGNTQSITYEGFYNYIVEDVKTPNFHPGLHRETLNVMIEQFMTKEQASLGKKQADEQFAQARSVEGEKVSPYIKQIKEAQKNVEVAILSNDNNNILEAKAELANLNNKFNIAQIKSQCDIKVASANVRGMQNIVNIFPQKDF